MQVMQKTSSEHLQRLRSGQPAEQAIAASAAPTLPRSLMRRLAPAAVAAMVFGFASFAEAAEETTGQDARLVGKWRLDFEKTGADSQDERSDIAELKNLGYDMRLHFAADGEVEASVDVVGKTRREKGRWSLEPKGQGGGSLKIQMQGGKPARQAKVEFLDKDHFRLTPAEGGKPVVFKRVPEAKHKPDKTKSADSAPVKHGR